MKIILEHAQAGRWGEILESNWHSSFDPQLFPLIVDAAVRAKQWDHLSFFLRGHSAQLSDENYNGLFYPLGMTNQVDLLRLLVEENNGVRFNEFYQSEYGGLIFRNLVSSKDQYMSGGFELSFDNADSLMFLFKSVSLDFLENFGLGIVGKAVYHDRFRMAFDLLMYGMASTGCAEKDNYHNFPAWWHVIQAKHEALLRLLLQRGGVKMTETQGGLTMMQHAVNAEWWEGVKTIAKVCSGGWETALHVALEKDLAMIDAGSVVSPEHIQAVIELIQSGARPSAEYMPKLLDFAVYHDQAQLIRPNLLGDQLNVFDNQKRAIDRAVKRGSWHSISSLLGFIDVKHAQALSYGYILFKALLAQREDVALCLINCGADVHYTYDQPGTFQGWSVLKMAGYKQCRGVEELLLRGRPIADVPSRPEAVASVVYACVTQSSVFQEKKPAPRYSGASIQCDEGKDEEGNRSIMNRDL